MRNVELKCRCRDPKAARERTEQLGARDAGVLEQEDTFFMVPRGRLKLRVTPDGHGELIAYQRPDELEARTSDYHIYRTGEPVALAAVLREALGEAGAVRKRRQLFLYRQTRIHLDEVEGLGCFVELETVISTQSEEEARAELALLAEALGLAEEEPVAVAYVDLLG